MNERIQELVGQAKFMAEETINRQISKNAELDAFAEKFAELIVRECAKFAYQYVDGNETLSHYREKDWKELPGDIEFCMKVHFGVEE
jgi:hypothetical protein